MKELKKPRRIDTSKMMPVSKDLLDNYMPCLCNGVIDSITKPWNKNNWSVEFHIPDNDYRDKDIQVLQSLINDDIIAFFFFVYEKGKLIANGSIAYSKTSGNISYYECDADNADDIKSYFQNLIIFFGEMNYLAKLNAMDKKEKKKHSAAHDMPKNHNIIYDFAEKEEQNPYVPKRIRRKKRKEHVTEHGNKAISQKVTHVVYKLEYWERAGYYRRDGSYVPPCSCKRHH